MLIFSWSKTGFILSPDQILLYALLFNVKYLMWHAYTYTALLQKVFQKNPPTKLDQHYCLKIENINSASIEANEGENSSEEC